MSVQYEGRTSHGMTRGGVKGGGGRGAGGGSHRVRVWVGWGSRRQSPYRSVHIHTFQDEGWTIIYNCV